MPSTQYDYIYEKLQEPIKIYLNSDTKRLLIHDFESFGLNNLNQFYNLLVMNYIEEYLNHLDKESREVCRILEEGVNTKNRDILPLIARKIAYRSSLSQESKEQNDYISLRINTDNTDILAEMIANAFDSVKVSGFFRNLFLSYLSLPAYKREQILFLRLTNTIQKAMKEGLKISYRNKNKTSL